MFNCTKTFDDDSKTAHEGHLIKIASVVGQHGNYVQANRAATKSGMFGVTQTLALELAESYSTANCVAPGFTETDMLDAVREDIRERIREEIPLRRFADVADIAGVVQFLASDESSYMTGQIRA